MAPHELITKIATRLSFYSKHLCSGSGSSVRPLPTKETVSESSCLDGWLQHAPLWNRLPRSSSGGRGGTQKTMSDLVWILLSYSRLCEAPTILTNAIKSRQKPRLAELRAETFNLSLRWSKQAIDPGLLKRFFDQLMLATVIISGRSSTYARENVLHTLKYSPADTIVDTHLEDAAARVAAGEDGEGESEGEGKRRKDIWVVTYKDEERFTAPDAKTLEFTKQRKLEVAAALTENQFIPMCSSVYFHISMQQRLLANALSQCPMDSSLPSFPNTRLAPSVLFADARRLFASWMQEQVTYEASENFYAEWEQLCYQLEGPLGGAMRKCRGLASSFTAARAEDFVTPMEAYAFDRGISAQGHLSRLVIDGDRSKILNDPKHRLRTALVLYLFSYCLKNERGVEFLRDYAVLIDQTRVRLEDTIQRTELFGFPARPVLVQLGCYWVIKCGDVHRYITTSVDDAILAWVYCTLQAFGGRMETGVGIGEWCATCWFPALTPLLNARGLGEERKDEEGEEERKEEEGLTFRTKEEREQYEAKNEAKADGWL